MPQSRIHDHFAPSNKYPRAATQSSRRPPAHRWESDSEGSDGLEAIQLSAQKPKPSRKAAEAPVSQKRGKRVVLDSDDEYGEGGQEEEVDDEDEDEDDERTRVEKRTRSGGKGKGKGRAVQSTEPESDDTVDSLVVGEKLRKAAKRAHKTTSPAPAPPRTKVTPSPKTRTRKRGSSPDFVIEVPSLSRERRSQYSEVPISPRTPSKKRKASIIALSSDPESDSDDNTPIIHRRRVPSKPKSSPAQPKRCRTPESDSDDLPKRNSPPKPKPISPKRAKAVDPDESEEPLTEEEDMMAELELDQPDRFKSKTRLRERKETDWQRALRKANNKRKGIVEDTTSEEESESEDEGEVEDAVQGGEVDEEDDDDFISDDDDDGPVQLPHEFSNNSIQTPEFKYKVVFHYLLYLVMKGSKALPLRGENAEYFEPHLRDVRRRVTGLRDAGVRSQIWSTVFVRALEKYPIFRSGYMDMEEPIWWCHACRRRMPSRYEASLDGKPYNHDTHEEVEEEESDSEPEMDPETGEPETQKRRYERKNKAFTMGPKCLRRSRIFHQMSHWEDDMYDRIRELYHKVLRASGKKVPDESDTSEDDDEDEHHLDRNMRRMDRADRRRRSNMEAAELKGRALPKDVHSVEDVLEWMDKEGWQTKLFHVMEDLEEEARALEHDKSTDRAEL